MKGPAIAMTSNSCPANLTIKQEISGAELLHLTTGSGAREKKLPLSMFPVLYIVQKAAGKNAPQVPSSAFWLITFCFYKDAEARALAKERQKKDNHNLSKFHPHPAPLSTASQRAVDGGQWTIICAALYPFS